MHWGGRINILKRQDFIILIDLLARNFPGNNLAKNAVWVMAWVFHRLASYLN
jgi:hypothetical protein